MNQHSTSDVAVIGGGVIGMMTARELALAGKRVTLYERNALGREASWAGGGIVSPLYPWRYSDEVTALASWAQDCYPQLAAELHSTTGIDPEFNPCGLLMLGAEDESAALQWAAQTHRAMLKLDNAAVSVREPTINVSAGCDALWMPYVGNIRNPRLLQALSSWLMARSDVTLYDHQGVSRVEPLSGRIRLHFDSASPSEFEQVVVCAGAWAAKLLRCSHLLEPSIEPVRGQMMLWKPRQPMLNSIVLSGSHYLIPRMDGRILAGSTLEYAGFDKSTTVEARQRLSEFAFDLLPALAKEKIERQWSGLRPGAPLGVPYIGTSLDNAGREVEGLFINAGHFRNGLVLAPASARLVTDIMTGRQSSIDPKPYAPRQRLDAAPTPIDQVSVADAQLMSSDN